MKLSRYLRRRHLWAAGAAALLAACGGGSDGPAPTEKASALAARSLDSLPPKLAALRHSGSVDSVVAPSLRAAKGPVDVWVTMADAPVSAKKTELRPQAPDRSWKDSDEGLRMQLRTHKQMLRDRQSDAMGSLNAMGARELGRVQVSHNAIAVRVDSARLKDIAMIAGVVSVRPVRHYQLALSETVPYVGGAAAQAAGKNGAGSRVAVFDSGIDYTHRNLGGAGTAAAYVAAYGTAPGDARQTTRDGLFPTAKVVEGFDFVGESWGIDASGSEIGTRTEDNDPIDFEGHGTHVADIIAGVGPAKGMAPGAKLVAVKVCSAVSSSCNGVALIKGVDYALDPNGDGSLRDAVDVINLSLGSSYGQEEDDLSFALSNAVKLGVSVVASAGNSADRPYIVGSPSAARGVLSVAQTQVPGALAFPLVVTGITPSTINNTALVEWAPIGSGFNGQVVRLGRGCPAGSTGVGSADDPYFNGNAATGKVALIDRGACSVSLKVDRATKAGALAVIIANNASGDPPSFSFGGGDLPMAPTIIISQADGNRIKTALGATGLNPAVAASVSPAVSVALVGSMVSSSSRGPGYSDSALKPEIGAPGASVSAIAGAGTAEEAFGGTSGAAPMVSGAAAILRGAFPNRSPEQIKAMLMNTAHTTVYTNPATQPGVLAPVSRIGAGEVRVDKALALQGVAWNKKSMSAAVGFGFAEVDGRTRLNSELLIENFSNSPRTYTVSTAYRYADDAASGATTIEVPSSVTVPPRGSRTIDVSMRVDGAKLPAWNFGSAGVTGGTGSLLQGNEVDGYITLTSGAETLSVPFHALLRKSSAISTLGGPGQSGQDIRLRNRGVNDGAFEIFALTGTSDRFKRREQAEPGENFTLVDLRAVGVRAFAADDVMQFAVSRWDRRAHPAYPAGIEIYIDSNDDGIDDYVVFNAEQGAFASSGQTLVYVFDLNSGALAAYFYLDADLQSGNGIFTVPMSAIGLSAGSKFRFSVLALDNYFTNNYTDAIEGMTFTIGTPRFGIVGDVVDGAVAAGQTVRLQTQAVAGGAAASPSQSGFLLMYRQNRDEETELITLRR